MNARADSVQVREQHIVETPPEIRQRRKRRVTEVVSQSLSNLPRSVLQLESLLSKPPVDLRRVSQTISTDPEFCELFLSLASTELFNAQSCGVTVPQAVVLFGSERLRTLALTCGFLKYAGHNVSSDDRRRLWQHSFLTAALSERTARQAGCPEMGQAHLGGLLHDIGRLPLLVVAREEEATGNSAHANWLDIPPAERERFGVDHCEVGRSIAAAWNLSPSLVDAIEHHHLPSGAKQDPSLAEIIAAGDRYSNLLSPDPPEDLSEDSSRKAGAVDALLRMCVPRLCEDDETGPGDFSRPDEFDDAEITQAVQ